MHQQKIVPQRQTTQCVVEGNETDIIVASFADRVFVIITQCGKIGSFVHCSSCDIDPGYFEVETIFGDRQKRVHAVYGRAIIQKLAQHSSKQVLLGIALKDESQSTFKEIMTHVEPLLEGWPSEARPHLLVTS
eukprot:Selendium_serpulae@DN1811_c0_g1_i1.p1